MKITGVDDVLKNLDVVLEKYQKATELGLEATAQQVRGTAIKSIQSQSAGSEVIRYKQGGGRFTHIAASEGEAPNTDTGALVKSIAIEGNGDNWFVGSGLDYAEYLELGTKNMRPRPWLTPAFNLNKKNIDRNIKAQAKRLGL